MLEPSEHVSSVDGAAGEREDVVAEVEARGSGAPDGESIGAGEFEELVAFGVERAPVDGADDDAVRSRGSCGPCE